MAAAARARASGSSAQRERKTRAGSAPSPRGRRRRGGAGRPSGRRRRRRHDRGAGDDVAAAVEREAGAGSPPSRTGLARRRFGDRRFDQVERPVAFGFAQVRASAGPRSGPSGCSGRGRRAAPSACRARGARSKTTVATNSSLSRLGALVIPYRVATCEQEFAAALRPAGASPGVRSWLSIWTTASLRKVAGPARNSTGSSSASSAQGPGSGFAPFGTLPERQPSSRSRLEDVRRSGSAAGRSPLPAPPPVLRRTSARTCCGRLEGRRVGVDQRAEPGVGRDPGRADRRPRPRRHARAPAPPGHAGPPRRRRYRSGCGGSTGRATALSPSRAGR